MSKNIINFEEELCGLINKYSLENDSNTHDFVLAHYLVNCLKSFGSTVTWRDQLKTRTVQERKPE